MKRILISLGVCGMLVMLLSATQDDPVGQELAHLRKMVADMGLRVSRLEHAAGVSPGAVDSSHGSASSDNVARSMVVGGIQQAKNPPANQDEIQDLNEDIDALQQTVNFHEDNASRVSGDTYYVGGYWSDGHYGYNHSNVGRNRQEMAQHQMTGRYASQLAGKKRQLDKLQHAAAEPHQILHGHDGDVIFTLKTKHNLSRYLKNINIGDTVTWRGERVSSDDSSEIWMITWIDKIGE